MGFNQDGVLTQGMWRSSKTIGGGNSRKSTDAIDGNNEDFQRIMTKGYSMRDIGIRSIGVKIGRKINIFFCKLLYPEAVIFT